jgi:hypothetical protein
LSGGIKLSNIRLHDHVKNKLNNYRQSLISTVTDEQFKKLLLKASYSDLVELALQDALDLRSSAKKVILD